MVSKHWPQCLCCRNLNIVGLPCMCHFVILLEMQIHNSQIKRLLICGKKSLLLREKMAKRRLSLCGPSLGIMAVGGGRADKSELGKKCSKSVTFEQLLFKNCLPMTTARSVVCSDLLDKVTWLFMTRP